MRDKLKKEKKTEEQEENRLYPAEEQGILPEETSQQKEEAMEHGEEDEDIYSEEGREKLEEDDEIEPWEEGFMEGASQTGQLGKDALTGEPLTEDDEIVEAEIEGQKYWFVSEKNARKFREKKELEEE